MTTTAAWRRPTSLAAVTVLFASVFVTVGGVASANHGATMSTGIYRIPYADGTVVRVTNDSHNHNDAYDMSAGQDSEIVAAASGWIRAIVDYHGEEPNPGDGLDAQDPPQPQDDTLEHACGNNDPGDTVATKCSDHNNYVWIEHPNGEYTKYSHLGTGTVSANWSEGDWIDAGEVIGLENDVGAASTKNGEPGDRAFHLHFEVAAANDPADDLEWSELGGFIENGTRRPARFCDIAGNDLLAGNNYTANPCNHQPPTADAGGPYVVDEGSTVQLDGTMSSDPEGNPLTYAWLPEADLDDPSLAEPTFSAVDDGFVVIVLTVYDQIEALRSTHFAGLTITNVAPAVIAAGDAIDEGTAATLSATIVDPGVEDTHTVTIDWGDGTPAQAVSPAVLPGGVDHTYGDNGTFSVTVMVTDDDGGVGMDTVDVFVANVAPDVTLDTSAAVAFPGGDYVVADPGEVLDWSADGEDPGSDDLEFAWNTGDMTTYFNDGMAPDPPLSPGGTFPFAASDQVMAAYGGPGVETLEVTLTDDDGGSDMASAAVIITGTAEATEGSGWWKHEFGGIGSQQLDDDLLDAYLDAVNAVSSVFSEDTSLLTQEEAHDVLSPTAGNKRDRARAALLAAWLHFVSGAVEWDSTVPLMGNQSIDFLTLMFDAEETILDPGATDGELIDAEQALGRVRHAE